MAAVSRHLTRTFIAGVVALLPIGGLVLSVVVAEKTIADSWLAAQPWYFPGLGLLAVVVITYGIGLFITTFIGRFLWRIFDSLLDSLPALGSLYKTLKQVLGYGEGQDAMFQRVVLVPGRDPGSMELGLVTNTIPGADGDVDHLAVFLPAAPTPTSGRMIMIDVAKTVSVNMSVHDALKFLIAVGKTDVAGLPAGIERAEDRGLPPQETDHA